MMSSGAMAFKVSVGSTVSGVAGACSLFPQTLQGKVYQVSYGRPKIVCASVSKQMKKVKLICRSAAAVKQWKFDDLMLVWDDAFQRFCDDKVIATSLVSLSRRGCAEFGRGCVFMEEEVNTKPRGSASGFSKRSRRSPSNEPELPFYTSLGWKAYYVPLEFINDPLRSPHSSEASPEAPIENGALEVVEQQKLLSALRGMDRTRLQALLSYPISDTRFEDAGGEQPYEISKNDVVVMYALRMDGQEAVVADVLRAYATIDGVLDESEELWTLRLRNEDSADLFA